MKKRIVEFVADHNNCIIQDIQSAFPDQNGADIKAMIQEAHDQNLINARPRRVQAFDGAAQNFGRMSITPEGRDWLQRTEARWR